MGADIRRLGSKVEKLPFEIRNAFFNFLETKGGPPAVPGDCYGRKLIATINWTISAVFTDLQTSGLW